MEKYQKSLYQISRTPNYLNARTTLCTPKRKRTGPLRRVLLCGALLTSNVVLAVDNVYQNSGSWNATSNWELNTLPTTTHTAIIESNSGVFVGSEVTVEAGVVQIGSSTNDTANLSILCGGELTASTIDLLSENASFSLSGGQFTSGSPAGTITRGEGLIAVSSGSFKVSGDSPHNLQWLRADRMHISGGTFEMKGGQVKFSNSPEVTITGDDAVITMDRLNVNSSSDAATFHFIFDSDGVSTIGTNQWMTLSHAVVTVNGSAYQGGAGTFELFKSNNLTSIGVADVSSSFPGYHAAFSQIGNSWVVTLSEVLEVPCAFLDIMPKHGEASIATTGNTEFTGLFESDAVALSGSPWTTFDDLSNTVFDESTFNDESAVAYAVLEHDASASTQKSFRIGVGQGGQIYSIRNGDGEEAIPPQHRGVGYKKMAPWIDEVFQLIQQNIKKHHTSGERYFIHQAGTYQYIDHMDSPFYSPALLAGQVDANTYVMANWVQQGHLDKTTGETMHKSESIVYTKYRVVADGVVEVSHLAYNFGSDRLDFFNIPWGGVRLSTYPEVMLGNKTSDGSVAGEFFATMPNYTNAVSTVGPSQTGGWLMYAAGQGNDDAAMALVFGAENFADHRGDVLRFGSAGGDSSALETEWRNYNVTEVIRYQNVDEGESLFARYYYVFGSVNEVKGLIDQYDLEEKTTVEVISSFNFGPLYSWRRSAPGAMPSLGGSDPVHLQLRDRPVNGNYKPVFLIEYGGDYIPTYDPYKYTNNKPYLRSTEHIGLLGYADSTVYDEADLN